MNLFSSLELLMRLGLGSGRPKIRRAGFSDTEYEVCSYLYYHPEVVQDRIARDLAMEKSTLARALSSMESRGDVDRTVNPDSRREKLVSLSKAARGRMERCRGIHEEWLADAARRLGAAKMAAFESSLKAILEQALIDRQAGRGQCAEDPEGGRAKRGNDYGNA